MFLQVMVDLKVRNVFKFRTFFWLEFCLLVGLKNIEMNLNLNCKLTKENWVSELYSFQSKLNEQMNF